ncbi:hypothetical protein CLAIMM_13784 [Cladophialophora immunda]|nr:hypothetical protein CLAIMM_13784 [Cladophialophora immunda]
MTFRVHLNSLQYGHPRHIFLRGRKKVLDAAMDGWLAPFRVKAELERGAGGRGDPHRHALPNYGHDALRQQIGKVKFITPNYADNTKVNISGILGKWQLCRFNEKMHDGRKPTVWRASFTNASWKALMQKFDWKTPLMAVDRAISMNFLYWICDNYQIKSWGTSWEYFRQFKQLYANVAGQYMDRNGSKEVHKYHHSYLVPKFKLQPPDMAGKQTGDSRGLPALQTLNIVYDTDILPHEDLRA